MKLNDLNLKDNNLFIIENLKDYRLATKSGKHYVYIHKDGLKPIYIGSGKDYRCIHTHRNIEWKEVYNKGNLRLEIYKLNLEEKEARDVEQSLIKRYGIDNLLNNITNPKENLPFSNKGRFNGNFGNRGSKNPLSKKVICLDNQGNFVKEYDSMAETELDGFVKNVVSLCCNGKRPQHKNHIFLFKRYYNPNRKYTIRKGKTSAKQILCFDLEGNFIKEYDKASETSIDGFSPKLVQKVCINERKTHKKHKFQYKI